ncbi:MAG: DUF6114 domain-containing protein [Candidatus Bathyarchaeia archaeon]
MSYQDKPTTAYVLSLIAGIVILIGGVVSLVSGAFMGAWFGGWSGMMGDQWNGTRDGWSPGMMGPGMIGPGMMGWWSEVGIALSAVGVAIGAIVIYSAVMLNSKPENHTTWGTLILVFSIISFIGAWGGFGIGLVLGIIGGALAISWKPSAPTPAAQVTGRFCTHCGRAVPADAKFCAHCGKELPA